MSMTTLIETRLTAIDRHNLKGCSKKVIKGASILLRMNENLLSSRKQKTGNIFFLYFALLYYLLFLSKGLVFFLSGLINLINFHFIWKKPNPWILLRVFCYQNRKTKWIFCWSAFFFFFDHIHCNNGLSDLAIIVPKCWNLLRFQQEAVSGAN